MIGSGLRIVLFKLKDQISALGVKKSSKNAFPVLEHSNHIKVTVEQATALSF